MSSEYLKAIAAGGEFDATQAIRALAKRMTEGPIEVKGSVTAGGGMKGLSFKAGGSGEAVSEAVQSEVEVIEPVVDGAAVAKKKK